MYKRQLYVFFDDGARVYVDHELVMDGWENATFASDGQRAEVPLTGGVFHDLVVEWRELTGAARVRLAWSSYSVVYETVPSTALYHASHIAGSPFATTIVPGRADFPFTTATGAALTAAVSGVKQTFRVTTKDATGNKLIRPLDEDDSADQIAVDILGPTTLSGRVEYVGDGEYDVTYTALKSGTYELSVKTGGTDIFCGLGDADRCSPFTLTVEPGAATAYTSEAESAPAPGMDYLVEAAAGDTGVFAIQAKDAFSNNLWAGGDDFSVLLTHKTDGDVQYRAFVTDHGNGTYMATYTAPIAGPYDVEITHRGEPLLGCPAPSAPYWWQRAYDGVDVLSLIHI